MSSKRKALDADALAALRRRLPRGYGPSAVARLAKKGHRMQEQTIYDNAHGKRFQTHVLEELFLIAEEHEELLRHYAARARGAKVPASNN